MRDLIKLPTVNLINMWVYAIIFSILVRVAFWIFTIFYPLPNEAGIPISPIYPNSGIDLNFYLGHSLKYKEHIINLYNIFFSVSDNGSSVSKLNTPPTKLSITPGPIFPIILLFTNFLYFPWILSFIYLLVSSYLVYISIQWLNKNGISWLWLFLYGVLPVPFWFMINISPDLLFATVVTLFYFTISSENKLLYNKKSIIYLILLSILSILLKPNGLSLLLFVFFILINSNFLANISKILIIIISVIIFILFIDFYGNYLISYIKSSNVHRTIFGYYQAEYFLGIYNFLPDYLNKFFSIFSLVVAKLLYLSGIRPSYGETLNFLVIIRSSAGLIIFPGLFWVFFKGSFKEKVFMVLFLLPIILGLAQERYSLPIYPILFFYGILFYSYIFKNIYNIFKST